MKYKIKILSVLLIFSVLLGSLPAKEKSGLPWDVGEKLTFSIRWGIITCGYAHMEIREKIDLGGRETFRIVTQARSAAFFDPFFKVRDKIESYIDAEKLHSVRYEKRQREGNYKKDVTIIYDHQYNVAYQNGKKFKISPNIQDVLSSLYYLRTKKLEVGKKYEFNVGEGKKDWPLVVDVVGKETVTVPAGKFKTFVVIPKLRGEGIFQAKGELKVWLTDDERKMPVLMKSKIEIGSITAVLIEKKLPKL